MASLLAILGLTAWRLIMAALLPITQDEAYYLDWARHWSLGYFDHPPAVAWFGAGIRLVPASAFAGRLGGLVAGLLTLILLDRLYRRLGLDTQIRALALLLVGMHLLGGAGGILITPDSLLLLAWTLALSESERALVSDPRRWLTAGAAIGFGLVSKYTMVLIGPVLLIAILWTDWRQLVRPWPWLGAGIAFLVFAPNLIWNAQNGWLTLAFQFGHGFAIAVPGEVAAEVNAIDHGALKTPAERFLGLVGYLAIQLGLWGLITLPMLWALAEGFIGRLRNGLQDRWGISWPPGRRAARILLGIAAMFPLGFFALVSLVSPVEANWPAMSLIGAAPFVAYWLRERMRWAVLAASGNLAVVTLLVIAVAQGVETHWRLAERFPRPWRETAGFIELADYVARLGAPVYADRYQLVAMLRFYRPDLPTSQWPGLERPSEYLRGQIAPRLEPERISHPFWLLTRSLQPPALTGLEIQDRRALFLCPGQTLVESRASPCPRPIQHWLLYRYRPARYSTPVPGAASGDWSSAGGSRIPVDR